MFVITVVVNIITDFIFFVYANCCLIFNVVGFVVWLADVDQLPAGSVSRSGVSADVAYAVDARRPRSGALRGS